MLPQKCPAKNYFNLKLFNVTIISFFILLCSFSSNIDKPEIKKTENAIDKSFYSFLSDSAFPDSTYTGDVFGDTLEVIIDGMDTIYILSEGNNDENDLEERMITSDDIIITLKDNVRTVNHGVYGVNLEGFFAKYTNTIAEQDEYIALGSLNPYQLLSELAPKVLRHPSGSSSKFQHPFGSMNSTDPANPKADLKNGGYGYCIEEIIRYYDKTDDELGNYTNYTVLFADMEDNGKVNNDLWMHEDDQADFESFYKKWDEQPAFEPEDFTVGGIEQIWEEPLYINNFIELIEKIETEKEYTIDVICAINVLSEPALMVKEMIDYLRDETLNHEYAVNVTGIELGNECYFKFFGRSMGFTCKYDNSAFDHYWAYINGIDNYDDYFELDITENDFVLEDVLDSDLMMGMDDADEFNRHDYIGVLRSDELYDDIKIGIPVETPQTKGAFVINTDVLEEIVLDCDLTWNEGVVAQYGATGFGENEYSKYIFDAVVPHLYFAAQNSADPDLNTNWGEIPIGKFTAPESNCLDNNTVTELHDNFNTTQYTYTSADSRLTCAFEGIIDPAIEGSFVRFVKQRQKTSMEDLALELQLDGTATHEKECWITELNIKNNTPGGTPDDLEDLVFTKHIRRDVYDNSFVHPYVLQEELMNNIKLSFQTEFQDEFIEITSVNNFMGGSSTDLVLNANNMDLAALGLIDNCSWDVFTPFLARTTYYNYKLSNQIHLNDLKYLKTTKTIYSSNINQPPTVFIKTSYGIPATVDVYCYFTNIKGVTQTYIINPGTLTGTSFDGKHGEIHCIDAKQLYSNSGKSELFNINNAYTGCAFPYTTENWFEISNERTPYVDMGVCPENMSSNSMCVTVPAYSAGYFVFSFNPSSRLGQEEDVYRIFPNPSSTGFVIQQNEYNNEDESGLEINIYSIEGNLVSSQLVDEGEMVDVSNLPVGVYTIFINSEGNLPEMETLVKMK